MKRLSFHRARFGEKEYKDALKLNKEEKNRLKLLKQQRKEVEEMSDAYKETFEALTGVSSKWKKTALGRLMQPGGMEGFKKAFSETFLSASNIIGSTMMKMQESTIAYVKSQDEAVISLNRTMGASGEYEDVIKDLEKQLVFHGVTMDEVREAQQAMITQMTDFTKASDDEQRAMAGSAAILTEMGVAADDVAKSFDVATKSFALGVDDATFAQRKIASVAQSLDVSVAEMAKQFVSAGPKLAKFGTKGTEAFIQLAAASKATGIAIDGLIRITEQFDQFDKAAGAVGRLNAMLGGQYLSTLDIMESTDPIDRIRMLQRAFRDAGVEVDNYWQMQSLAKETGMSVDEVTKILNGDLEEQMLNAQKDAKTWEELTDALSGFQTLSDEWIQTMRVFAVDNRTLIDGIVSFAKGLMNLIQRFPKFFFWIGVIGAGLAAWRLISVATGLGSLVTNVAAYGKTAASAAMRTRAMGLAAKTSFPQLAGLALVFLRNGRRFINGIIWTSHFGRGNGQNGGQRRVVRLSHRFARLAGSFF